MILVFCGFMVNNKDVKSYFYNESNNLITVTFPNNQKTSSTQVFNKRKDDGKETSSAIQIGDIITNDGIEEEVFAINSNGGYITMPKQTKAR